MDLRWLRIILIIVHEELSPEVIKGTGRERQRGNGRTNSWRLSSRYSLTLISRQLELISTVPKFSIEQLDCYHSEDKLEQHINDQNIEDILEGGDDAIEYRLRCPW